MSDTANTATATTTAQPAAGAEPAATTATTAAVNWIASAPDEIRGHAQNHGWDKLPPHEAALKAIQSHREAQQLLGVPKDQLLRLPDPKNPESVKSFWQRLGTPAKPEEYDFSMVKFSNGDPLDDEAAGFLRKIFHETNVPRDAATRITSELVKYMENQEKKHMAERQAKLAEQKAALEKNWGVHKEANLFVARQAAAKLGVQPQEVDALESVIGYDRVMEMFRAIGERLGEARFIASGPASQTGGVMTREQAVARKQELMKDQAWVSRYLNGDAEASREMQALNRLITQGMTFNPLNNQIVRS